MSPEAREIYAMELESWSLTDRIDAFVAGVVLATGCFIGGFELRGWIEGQKLAPEIVTRVPLTQWDCTQREFREHAFACNQRERSSAVKPPKRQP